MRALIDLLEKGRLKQAMELIDTHHRAVVRGYIMDRAVFPELTPREALAPYLDEQGRRQPRQRQRGRTAKADARRRTPWHAST